MTAIGGRVPRGCNDLPVPGAALAAIGVSAAEAADAMRRFAAAFAISGGAVAKARPPYVHRLGPYGDGPVDVDKTLQERP